MKGYKIKRMTRALHNYLKNKITVCINLDKYYDNKPWPNNKKSCDKWGINL